MWEDIEVSFEKADSDKLKPKPSSDDLGFGKYFTDHMFLMKWNHEKGWHDAKLCPNQDFNLSPAAMVFHYGQAIFEGMKAYLGKDNQIFLFRPMDNLERMNLSAVRMCMPRFPVDMVLKALKALLYIEKDWVPASRGSSLYIRPTMIATESALGVRPAGEYYFYIILSPVGAYYSEGLGPTRIYVSEKYVRAVDGGVGEAKTAGNYAASLFMCELAKRKGYTQALWLDACEHKYIEEIGTSNIFFRIKDQVVTPPLGGSILKGITRDSVLKLLRSWQVDVDERPISIDEVIEASENGSLQEAFGAGTAAVVSPVGEFHYQDKEYVINGGKTGELSEKIYNTLQAIQYGHKEDPFQWISRVG